MRCRAGDFGFLDHPTGGIMLGLKSDWVYKAETKVLRPGTTLLFYTDGLIEARDRSLDDGMDDLQAFVEGLEDLSPQALCDKVVEWRLEAAVREDDICILAARLGTDPRRAVEDPNMSGGPAPTGDR
jgi:serine phosphatase RsbU (regulator of sigma subunit)